jgi:hypothetical protein
LRHPSDAAMNGSGYHTNTAHWVSGTGDGFGIGNNDGLEGVPRLRFQVPTATDFNSSVVPSQSNQVFCYTCHLAHGGPFQSSLTWPYKSGGSADLYSGCQQCHYK